MTFPANNFDTPISWKTVLNTTLSRDQRHSIAYYCSIACKLDYPYFIWEDRIYNVWGEYSGFTIDDLPCCLPVEKQVLFPQSMNK